jgi:beta-glucanase (GH16 family)
MDVECKWGQATFVLPSCDASMTVAELREVASEETLVPVARLKLIGLKTAANGRLAQDGNPLGSLRLTRGGSGPDDPPTLTCICMGTPDAYALVAPVQQQGSVQNDLDGTDEAMDGGAPPPAEVMSHFEWLLRSGRLPPPYANLELAWSDEFTTDGLPDELKWGFDVECNRWISQPSHGELQRYTAARGGNARVQGGRLVIEARREECEGSKFTSARLRTRGCGDWLYGRVEVCAMLPEARRGLWPAIWMLPTDTAFGDWPASGEIDILEQVGHEPGIGYGSVHTGLRNGRRGNHARRRTSVPECHRSFHVYALEWEPDELRFFVDGRCFFRVRRESAAPASWPFTRRFHLVINLAVGGRWAGRHGVDESAFPAKLEVNYVRVWQLPGQAAAEH